MIAGVLLGYMQNRTISPIRGTDYIALYADSNNVTGGHKVCFTTPITDTRSDVTN